MSTVTRQQLYDYVWSRTLRDLAADFETSYGQLVKACKALNVPRPKPGHWNLVAIGRSPERAPLPPGDDGAPVSVVLASRVPRPRRSSPSPEPQAVVAALPDHSLITASRKALEKAKVSERGLLQAPRNRKALALDVSPAELDRALSAYAVVLGVLPTIDAKLEVRREERDGPFETWVAVDGESIRVEIKEKVRRKERPATEEEKRRLFLWTRGTVYTYHPTGRLTFSLVGLDRTGIRQRWADSPSHGLEEKLAGLGPGLRVAAASLKEQRAEWERRRREAEERRKREEELRRQREKQQALTAQMHQMHRHWRAATRLWEFIDAAVAAVPAELRDSAFDDWIEHATAYAAELDPLSTPEKAIRMLTTPDGNTWYSEQALGHDQPNRHSVYPRTW